MEKWDALLGEGDPSDPQSAGSKAHLVALWCPLLLEELPSVPTHTPSRLSFDSFLEPFSSAKLLEAVLLPR